MNNILWEKSAEENFNKMISKIPPVLRSIAKDKVSKKAIDLAKEDNRLEISEKNMVDAFFAETPGGFHGPMKVDMEDIGLDYTKYGYEKDEWKKIMGDKPPKKDG